MKLILQAIKSLLNNLRIRLAELENKTSDESIASGKLLPDSTPFAASFPYSFYERVPYNSSQTGSYGEIYHYNGRSVLNLTVGNTYTVSYNGTEYECECKIGEYYGRGCYLGNGEFVEGESSSEPFTVFVPDEPNKNRKYNVITKERFQAVELSINGENEYIRKMDERLLPDGLRTLVIDASIAGGVVTIESGHTFRDVLRACSEEKNDAIIRCEYDGDIYVYRLSRFDETMLYFTCIENGGGYVLCMSIKWRFNGELSCEDGLILT